MSIDIPDFMKAQEQTQRRPKHSAQSSSEITVIHEYQKPSKFSIFLYSMLAGITAGVWLIIAAWLSLQLLLI